MFRNRRYSLILTNADPKRTLRREALAHRRAVASGVRAAFSRRLAEEGSRLARLWRPEVVSAFHPLGDEPDTLETCLEIAPDGDAFARHSGGMLARGVA